MKSLLARAPHVLLSLTLLAGACGAAEGAAEAIQRGDALYAKRQYTAAAEAYRVAVRAEPRDAAARLKLADALRGAGEWAKAAGEITEAAGLLPDDKGLQMRALSVMLEQEQFSDVLDRVAKKLETDPDNPTLHVLSANATARMANSWIALESFDRAVRSAPNYRLPEGLVTPRPASADRVAEQSLRRALEIDPDHVEAAMALANLLFAMGRMDEGAPFLKRAADREPSDVLVNRSLGFYYALRGRDSEAETYLKTAAATADRNSRLALANFYAAKNRSDEALALLRLMAISGDTGGVAAIWAADIELRLGRLDLAWQRAQRILVREPNNAGAMRIKAEVLLAKGDTTGAIAIAQAAVNGAPASREARMVLARCLAATGNAERAFEHLSEAWRLDTRDADVALELAGLALSLDRAPVAAVIARQGLQLRPGDQALSILLARALVRTGDFAAADLILNSKAAPELRSADVLVLRAAIQAGLGNRDGARATYARALSVDPDSFDGLSGLAGLELQERQVAQAKSRVDQALARHPKDPRYLLLDARVSIALGDAKRAESGIRAVLASDPAQTEAALLLTDLLARQNRRGEARQALEQALALRPSSFTLQIALANLLEDMGQIAEARKRYEAMVAANPDEYAVQARLAVLYANQGDNLDVALNLAQAAKQRLPKDPFVDDTLGWVYVRKGFPQLARPHLESAVRADPNRAPFRYHLGVAYERLGEVLKARDQLTRALALDPEFQGAAEARGLLKTLPK